MMSVSPSVEEITIRELLEAYQTGTTTVRAVVEEYLRRIEMLDRSGPSLNSIVAVSDSALARADELDRELAESGQLAGPLHGVVVAVKDNIDTVDMDTTCGSEALKGHRPEKDAVAVARLRDAGAVIIAKTTLPDFASSWFSYSSVSGETLNPHRLSHDPGGSSSGSAAAVAANLATVALGTDCGGSVRLPASFCNLVGVRSTPGVVPRTGTGFLVEFQDTVGPLARTVEDAVAVFDVIAGYDEGDAFSVSATMSRPPRGYQTSLGDRSIAGTRIGLVTNALGDESDARCREVNTLARRAAADMRAAGAEVVEVEIPDLDTHLADTSQYVACSRHDIDLYLTQRPTLSHLRVADIVESGRYHPELDLLEAVSAGPEDPESDPDYTGRYVARDKFTRTILNVMERHDLDALTYPTTRVPAPSNDERQEWTVLTFPTNTLIASQALLPSVTVPAGFTVDEVPVGVELVGRPHREADLFRWAAGYERASQHRRAPEL
ncbi:amidase [Microbacterium sp. AR7-10]|uniref:amidase n=1 Tax=Microbacterium sp. AR7-10 TaxID=1891970 RepID=UPI0015A6188A|nr:amidase [Microbacterium sp. AR7-10]